jgi:hypothetical protein
MYKLIISTLTFLKYESMKTRVMAELKDIEVCANTCDAWKSIASEGFQVIF